MPQFRRLPLIALLTAAAGVTHIAAAVPHFADATVFGLSFVGAGWVQLALAAALLVRPRRPVVAAAALINVLALAAWALSRTVGLPLGHSGVEPVALADAITVGLELAAVGLIAARWAGSRIMLGRTAGAIGVLGIAVIVATGASATAIAALGTSGHGHGGTESQEESARLGSGGPQPPESGGAGALAPDRSHQHADGTWHLHQPGDAHEHPDRTVHVHTEQNGPAAPDDPGSSGHDDGHDHAH